VLVGPFFFEDLKRCLKKCDFEENVICEADHLERDLMTENI